MLLGDRSSMMVDTSSPLPYDYEVEYIQRDFGVDWVEGGKAVRGGFDILDYLPSEGFSDWNLSYETEMCACSYDPPLTGTTILAGFFTMPRFLAWFGHGIKPDGVLGNYVLASGNASQTIDTGVPMSLSAWHIFKTEWKSGVGYNSIDGVSVADSSSTVTTIPSLALVLGMVAAGGIRFSYMIRVRRFKFGDKVDFIPVVIGDQCGFYNKVDGVLFLANQSCLTAGPAVK